MLRVLRKVRPLEQGEIHLSGRNMKQSPWTYAESSDMIVMPLLTASENLTFYVGLSAKYLSGEIYKKIKS